MVKCLSNFILFHHERSISYLLSFDKNHQFTPISHYNYKIYIEIKLDQALKTVLIVWVLLCNEHVVGQTRMATYLFAGLAGGTTTVTSSQGYSSQPSIIFGGK